MQEKLQYLRSLIAQATPGPLVLATSNSWRRILGARGVPVCEPVKQSDDHPDLHFANGGNDGPDAKLLLEAWNAMPDLLDEIDRLNGLTMPAAWDAAFAARTARTAPDGWRLVPVEPTERMVIDGFDSVPTETWSPAAAWDAYEAMSGCEQAAHRARLCWAAMLASAPPAPVAAQPSRHEEDPADPVKAVRERHRREDAVAVMPLIEPLLDVWDGASHDDREAMKEFGVGRHIEAIYKALTDPDISPRVEELRAAAVRGGQFDCNRFALDALVAAGHVNRAKVDEALAIAAALPEAGERPGEQSLQDAENERQRVGDALSTYLGEMAEGGVVTLEPFDATNIDGIIDVIDAAREEQS